MSRRSNWGWARTVARSTCIYMSLTIICVPSARSTEDYPSRPIRMIVPIAPGGGTDLIARVMGQGLSKTLGQPVVVDNRAGAGGLIGMRAAAQAPNDGYTLVTGNIGSIALSPVLYKDPGYDTLRDFEPVSLLATAPLTLVANNSVHYRSVKDLVDAMKADPGRYSFGSSGLGQSTHLAAELFKIHTGLKSVVVPYRGAAPAVTDLLAGNVQLIFDATQSLPHVKAGKLRALAVASARRSPLFAGVPTMAEAGVPGFEVSTWFGMLAPRRTPKRIVDRINGEVVRIIGAERVKQQISDLVMSDAVTSTPSEFGRFIASEISRWRELIQKTGMRAE